MTSATLEKDADIEFEADVNGCIKSVRLTNQASAFWTGEKKRLLKLEPFILSGHLTTGSIQAKLFYHMSQFHRHAMPKSSVLPTIFNSKASFQLSK